MKDQTEKHHMFWVFHHNPITMYQDDVISKSERIKRNKMTWDKIVLLIALAITIQSCGTYCGAAKFRNSNKYYGAHSVETIKSDICG